MNRQRKVKRRKLLYLKKSDESLRAIYEAIFDGSDAVKLEYSTTIKTHRITYAEAAADIEALASAISDALGADNSYIGLYGDSCPMWPILFWAILRSGNRPFLINTRQPLSTVREHLCTLGAVTVITLKDSPELSLPCHSAQELLLKGKEMDALPRDAFFADELALSTSGTGLAHKICIYNGRSIANQIYNTESIVRQNSSIAGAYCGKLKHLVLLPLYHIFGLCAVYLWFCFFEATFVFPKSLSPDTLLHTVRRHDVTHIFAVPLFWHTLEKSITRRLESKDASLVLKFERACKLSIRLQAISPALGAAFARSAFESVREELFGDSIVFCISGGSYLRPSAQRLINALGYPLYNGYGMTEIGISSVELSKNIKTRLLSSIGKPFPSVSYVLSENGHLLVGGSSRCSELIIDGVRMGMDDLFDTDDIVECDRDGRYHFASRAGEVMIGEDGENINPDIVKNSYHISGAVNFDVIRDDNDRPVLVVEIPLGTSDSNLSSMRREIAATAESLPLSYRPSRVIFTSDSIMSEREIKVSRARLSQKIKSGEIKPFSPPAVSGGAACDKAQSGGEDESEGEIRATVRALFASLLSVNGDEIPPDSNFMTELGGSSLDYYTLISELDRIYDITLPYECDGFKYSLNDFERLIKERLNR